MDKKKIIINPSTSGISLSLDLPLLKDHANLVNKYLENLKLLELPLDLITLFNAKLVALLTDDDPILSSIVEALQIKVEVFGQLHLVAPY